VCISSFIQNMEAEVDQPYVDLVCMYLYMYVCVCVCMHVCVYVGSCVCVNACMESRLTCCNYVQLTRVCVHIFMYVREVLIKGLCIFKKQAGKAPLDN
jgi:hypothetical protein